MKKIGYGWKIEMQNREKRIKYQRKKIKWK